MSPERARKVRTLFDAVLEQDPAEWIPFIKRECGGDEELEVELLRLLDAHRRLGGPIPESPSEAEPPDASQTGSLVNQRVGNYRIIRELGSGGMGVVYLADQLEPIRRQVALKVIKLGMNSRAVIARFESERQALALMAHPAIAKVFDAGSAPNGAPFFVMEYVDGVPINKHCDDHRLSTQERLELFIHVCEGVQHAHQKAIIHRDLKPSNILVTEVDGKPAPKIIDFGVAKALNQPLTADTLFTLDGQIVGTPEYMSPEQASSTGADIDTRSDVYSLGIILYELLAGSPPIELRKIAFDEFLRRLREDDPPRPSTRIRTQDQVSSSHLARKRHTEPAALARQISGDLDSIALKALEKDRSRRYGSPSDFAADIGRYLRNEPVLARSPSAAYLARKYVRRHGAVVAFAAVIALLLVAAALAQTLELRRTRLERDGADRERDRAGRVTNFMTDMFKLSDPSEARGNDVRAREILDKASSDIETGLSKDPELRAQMMNVMGNVYQNLGLYSKAGSLLRDAVEIRRRALGAGSPDTLQSMYDLARVLRAESHNAEAEKLGREALEGRRQVLGPKNRDTVASMTLLATIFSFEGRYPEAEKLHGQALEVSRRAFGTLDELSRAAIAGLAIDLAEEGKYPEAEQAFRESLDNTRRALGRDSPETLTAMANFSQMLSMQDKFADAEKVSGDALQGYRRVYGPEHPKTLICMGTLASILYGEKRYAEAEKLYRETIVLDRKVLGPEHRSTLITMGNLADVLLVEGKSAEAGQVSRQTLDALIRTLGPDHSVTLYEMDRLGLILKKEKRYAAAENQLWETLNARRRVLRPGHPITAKSAYELAEVLAIEGKRDEAFSQLSWAMANGLGANIRRDVDKDGDLKSLRGDPRFAAIH